MASAIENMANMASAISDMANMAKKKKKKKKKTLLYARGRACVRKNEFFKREEKLS